MKIQRSDTLAQRRIYICPDPEEDQEAEASEEVAAAPVAEALAVEEADSAVDTTVDLITIITAEASISDAADITEASVSGASPLPWFG